MLKRYRKALLFLALAGVIILAIYAPAPDEPPTRVKGAPPVGTRNDAAPLARAAVKEQGSRTPLNETLERDILGNAKADLFGLRSWLPPPAPPPKVVASPVDVQPPVPPPPPQSYRFAGRLQQDGSVQFFVSKGDTPIPVKLGDNLDGYVVESIADNAIALVFPPSGQKESIVVPPGLPGDAPAVPVGKGSLSPPPVPVLPPKPPLPLARVQWQGPAQVKAGANFTVALRVLADQAISSSPMQVRFDPSILESVAVRPGKRYIADAKGGFNYRINPPGMIVINASTRSAAGNDPELLVLTFKPRKSGAQAEVNLTSLNLQGAEGRPVAHDVLASFRAPVVP
jgi:hypothetical protein